MKKLKRTLAVLLTVAAVLTLTACGNQPGSTSNGGAPAQVARSSTSPSPCWTAIRLWSSQTASSP